MWKCMKIDMISCMYHLSTTNVVSTIHVVYTFFPNLQKKREVADHHWIQVTAISQHLGWIQKRLLVVLKNCTDCGSVSRSGKLWWWQRCQRRRRKHAGRSRPRIGSRRRSCCSFVVGKMIRTVQNHQSDVIVVKNCGASVKILWRKRACTRWVSTVQTMVQFLCILHTH